MYNLSNTTASTLITPGQGFFVSADATNTPLYNLEFTPTMRSTGISDDFIPNRNAQLVYLKLNASTNNKSYRTEFYFNSNVSLGMDFGYDAKIWGANAPNFALYSHLVEDNNGLPKALQALNVTDLSNVSIPLGVNANQGEQLTFSILESTLPATVDVYLDDTIANTSTLLNNSDSVLTPNTNLSGTGCFFLRYTEDALSKSEDDFSTIQIYATKTPRTVFINGMLPNNTKAKIFDLQGRLILNAQLNSNNTSNQIDVSDFSSGVYIVKLGNGLQQKSQKVIIK